MCLITKSSPIKVHKTVHNHKYLQHQIHSFYVWFLNEYVWIIAHLRYRGPSRYIGVIGFQICHTCSMNNKNLRCQKCSKVNRRIEKLCISFSFCSVSKTDHAALPDIHEASPAHGHAFLKLHILLSPLFLFVAIHPAICAHMGKRWENHTAKFPRIPRNCSGLQGEYLHPLPKAS